MFDVNEAKQAASREVDVLLQEAIGIAKDIHANPEVGWETPYAVGLLTDYMERHGLDVERGVANLSSAFRASIPGRFDKGPGIAMLAEYDALPGLGHACSHNLIGTIAATAGIAVARAIGELPGNIYVMGCPYEEAGGGKVYMLEAGVFDVADASLMFHGSNRIQVGSPNICAAFMTYKFYGKTAHSGGNPHEGVNAADAAMLTMAAMNALRQHVTSDVRIGGIISEAGTAPNIIPDYAEIRAQARCSYVSQLEPLLERVHNCARAGALATGTRLEIEQDKTYAERVMVPEFISLVTENLLAAGVDAPSEPVQGFASADSGNVSHKVPHVSYNLPMDDKGSVPHTSAFEVACNSDQAWWVLEKAAKIMATSALDLMANPERLNKIKEEHRREAARHASYGDR